MSDDSLPDLRRTLVTSVKISYYEMVSIILLSGLFWVATVPVFTVGSAILSLFRVINDIYDGTAPTTELKRAKYFLQLVRANSVRGLPLSLFIIFLIINTIWYLLIVLSEQMVDYIIGVIIGVYVCFLFLLFSLRVINTREDKRVNWRSGVRLAVSISVRYPSFTVLQISIAGLAVLVSIVFPIGLLFLLPGGLIMFELVFYDELNKNDPQEILDRYTTDI